jgi:FkbM family methyltransferase
MEKIIHFTVPARTSPAQEEAIATTRDLHRGWTVKVWQDPVSRDGFLLEPYWPKASCGAQFADLLRLDLVYRYGGIYLDSDMRLLRPLDALAETYDFFVASEDGQKLTNAAFGATARHPAIRALIDNLLAEEPDWAGDPPAMTGPGLFTRALRGREDITVLPRQTFYPYNFDEPEAPPHRHTFGEHTWAHSWKERGADQPSAVRTQLRRLKRRARHTAQTRLAGARYMLRHAAPIRRAWRGADDVLIETIHGHRLVLEEGALAGTRELMRYGCCDFPAEMFLQRVLRPGDWVVEVGAETAGCALLSAERVGSFGKVIVYEPDPHRGDLLARSAALNGLERRVLQRRVAAGDVAGADGPAPSRQSGGREGPRELAPAGGSAAGTAASNAVVVRLDEELPIDLPIRVLNVDVPSQSVRVLAGARRLIENRCFDFILLKHDGAADSRLEHEIALAHSFGYRSVVLTRSGRAKAQSVQRAASVDGGGRIVLTAE